MKKNVKFGLVAAGAVLCLSLLSFPQQAYSRRSSNTSSQIKPDRGDVIISEAQKLLGVPYDRPHVSHSVESGRFVKEVFERLGLELPSSPVLQAKIGRAESTKFQDLRPGDRLYFRLHGRKIDHAGIYLGEDYFIHTALTGAHIARIDLVNGYYLHRLFVVRHD